MGPLKSPFLSGPRPTSAASTRPPPLRHRHNRLPPPPPPPPLPLPPPPPLPPASSRPPLPSSSLPLPPPYPPPHALQMPPSPPLPPPPPLPPVTSHMTRLSPSPPSPPPRRTLRKPPRRRTASSDSDLPTIVLALACPGSTLRVRKRHSVEQVVPAPGVPTTLPVCDTVSIEGLAAVPLEKLPPKKRLMRSYQNEAASTIQEVASHGHGDGFGDRPVSPTVEGDGNGGEFGNRPVSPAVDGDGFKNRPVSPTGDGDGDGEGFKNRSVSPTGDGEGYENRSVSPTGDGDGEGFENRTVSPTGDGEGFGNQPVPLAVEGDGEGFGNLPVPLAVEGGGDAGAGIRGEEPQVYRDYDGLRAELHRLHVSRPALMMTKRLTPSDRTRDKGRLVLPDVLVRESPLLGTMTEAEWHLVLAGGGLRVPAFDRVGRQYRMVLKRDRLARTYRLTGQWSLFLSRHGSMRDGDTVEVVAFRPPGWQARLGRCGEGGLGMALVHCRGARRAARTFWNNWESNAADGGLVLPVGNPARQERLPRRRRRRWASRESQRPHPTFLGVAGPGAVYQNWSGA